MRENLVEVVERQNEIITIQSGVIDELFRLLSQHITAAELDALSVIAEINHAAQIRAEIT
jgi:predicted nucleic acid-binding protein